MSNREDEVKVEREAEGGPSSKLTEEEEQFSKLMREIRFNPPRTESAEEMEHYMKYVFTEKETGDNTKGLLYSKSFNIC
jgi:hypothetical protein